MCYFLLFWGRNASSDIYNYSSFWFHMMQSDFPADSNSISFDESKALAQALQEKVQLQFSYSFVRFWSL
jgi:hypothetical protein